MYAHVHLLNFIRHGVAIRWYRNLGRCPCYDPKTGRWDKGHTLCGGTGRLHEEVPLLPDRAKGAYVAIISSARAGRRYLGQGQLEEGDLACSTWPSQIPLVDGDILSTPTRVATTVEAMVRGTGPADALREEEVAEILSIHTLRGRVADGFAIVQGRYLVWQSDAVDAGERYTVAYRYVPRWVVKEGSVALRQPDSLGREMPQAVTLKLWNPNAMDGSSSSPAPLVLPVAVADVSRTEESSAG